ncbi:MAG: 3-dehydroquinate synthase [Niastella sp.]|nr:3-dehydroquinate synthase [Niastella sp.]
MNKQVFTFSNRQVSYIFDANLSEFLKQFERDRLIILTDENLYEHYAGLFSGMHCVVQKAGEASKTQKGIDKIIDQLLQQEATRNAILVAVGGGVITDMGGFIASIYKRGIQLILVPASILAMTDAAIGGKNGINVNGYKNMVGTVYQPTTIVFDYSFLKTLPKDEWINGFAEIIKHACIKDEAMFTSLQHQQLENFMDNPELISLLIEQNARLKTEIVQADEYEKNERKLLNFGHTVGHAIENQYQLPHGQAISIGMAAACKFSEEMNMFYSSEKEKVLSLLNQYHLQTNFLGDKEKIWETMLRDKKREKDTMDFILLNKIGEGRISSIGLDQLKEMVFSL